MNNLADFKVEQQLRRGQQQFFVHFRNLNEFALKNNLTEKFNVDNVS